MLFIFYLPFTIIITIKYQTLSLVKVCFSSWVWLTLISCSLFSLFVCFLVMRPLSFGISLDHGLYLTWVKCIFVMLWAAGEKKQALRAVQFSFYFFRSHVRVLHAQTIMRAQICHLSPVPEKKETDQMLRWKNEVGSVLKRKC